MFKGKECWKAEKMTILRGIYKEDQSCPKRFNLGKKSFIKAT